MVDEFAGVTTAQVHAARRALRRRQPVALCSLQGKLLPLGPLETVRLQDALGTRSEPFTTGLIAAINDAVRSPGATSATLDQINAAFAYIGGTEPANELEASAALLLYVANLRALSALVAEPTNPMTVDLVAAVATLTAAMMGRPAAVSNACAETG